MLMTTITRRVTELRSSVQLLMEIARSIKVKRVGVGALELESAEIRVKLDENHKNVTDLVPKAGLEIHETVAECMIFANQAVAEKISTAFPSASLLRRHPLPRTEHFEQLIASAALRGFEIDVSSNFTLARSLDGAVIPDDPEFNRCLRRMATQAMAEATYFSTSTVEPADWFVTEAERGLSEYYLFKSPGALRLLIHLSFCRPCWNRFHYGLGLSHYTHFTSPIRRYADIVVHRQLMATLAQEQGQGHLVHSYIPGPELEQTARHINMKNRASKIAQRESLEFFTALFFINR